MAAKKLGFVTESPGLRQAPLREGSFVGHTHAKHSRQRYVTTGLDKGLVTGVGGGPATKRSFNSQPNSHMSYSLNSLKGGYIGDYYKGYLGGY